MVMGAEKSLLPNIPTPLLAGRVKACSTGEKGTEVLLALRDPGSLLGDLLSAFEQDVSKHAYADRTELLDYCRCSANPVGRLLLHLYGVHSGQALQQADAICSALQLANFWQDLGIDIGRGRLYIPVADCERRFKNGTGAGIKLGQ